MALALTKSSNSPRVNPLIGETYARTLNQSIRDLLAAVGKGDPNFSDFIDKFCELMQAKVDPPLESIWVYAALTVRCNKSTDEDPLNRISALKNIFQLISSCSASCSSSKSIALLAPVVLEVYKLVSEYYGNQLACKREKKLMKEIKSFVEVIAGYVSVCCCKDMTAENGMAFVMPIEDLVRVWMGSNAGLESFLPLVSSEICQVIKMRGWDVNYLAGVVICEAFLLKLCLSSHEKIASEVLEKELKSWAVGSISAFQNICFFEILLLMLLESTLPVATLVGLDNEAFLRKILLDAVILVEYSFLSPHSAIDSPVKHMKSLAMERLIVTHEAIELFRTKGDHTRAISYTSAFSSSKLPSVLIKWVTSQIGMDEKASDTCRSSPKALIKWLLNLEAQGLRVFDDTVSKCRAKLVLDISRTDYEYPGSGTKRKESDTDLFYVDNEGEDDGEQDEMTNDSMNAVFMAAAQAMKLAENGERKRKGRKNTGTKKRNKFSKHEPPVDSETSRELFSASDDDDSARDSDVENPPSDEDMEASEH